MAKDYVTVRFTKDCLAAPEGHTTIPFEEGQEALVPQDFADVVVEDGSAKVVKPRRASKAKEPEPEPQGEPPGEAK